MKLITTSAPRCPERRNPVVVFSMNCTQQVRGLARDGCHGRQRVAPFYHATHTSSTWLLHFCHHSFWPFDYAVHHPGDVHEVLFCKSATTLRLVEQAFWKVPLTKERSCGEVEDVEGALTPVVGGVAQVFHVLLVELRLLLVAEMEEGEEEDRQEEG